MAQQTPQKGRQISLVCRNHLSRNFCRRYEWPSSRLLCRRIYDLEHKSHSMGLFFFFLSRFGTRALGKKHFTKRQRFTSTSNFRCHQPPPSSLGFILCIHCLSSPKERNSIAPHDDKQRANSDVFTKLYLA